MMDALLSTAINYFTILVSLFPTADVNMVNEINEFMSVFRGGMAIANVFFPVSVLMWALGIVLTIEGALFAFKIWRWVVANVSLGYLSG